MANKTYPAFIRARMVGSSTEDLSSAGVNVKAVLVDTAAYTYSDAHDFLDDIPGGARIATSANLANKAVTIVGDDVNITADNFDMVIPASQPTIEAIAFYIDTGVASTSRLLRYHDTGAGFPFTPNAAGETRQIRPDATGFMRFANP
jgi:hypothetical protein